MDAFAKQQFKGQTMMSLRMLFNRNKQKENNAPKVSTQFIKEMPNGDKVTEIKPLIDSKSTTSGIFSSHSGGGVGCGGGGNFIPGAAGVGIIETTLTMALQEEQSLRETPAANENNMVLFEDQREKQVFSSEAGKRSELLKLRIMRHKDSGDDAMRTLGFDRPVKTAVGGDRYTKIGNNNTSHKPPRNPHHYQTVLNRMRNRLSSQGRSDTSDDDEMEFDDMKKHSRQFLGDHLSGATLNTVTNFSDLQTQAQTTVTKTLKSNIS